MMPSRACCAFLFALGLAGGASAETMEFDCPAPGTTISFDSGVKVVARGRSGMDCDMQVVGGTPFKMRALLFANPSADGSDMTAFIDALRPERLWPLEVGKKIEASYDTPKGDWSYILTVVRTERRTGPRNAMVDTFVIEMQEHGDNGFRSLSRWWISPADKYMIRFDASNSAGTSNRAVVLDITN